MTDNSPILVPLDGSEVSEGALAYAVALARAYGVPLTLVTAWEGTESEFGASFPALAVEVEQKATSHFGAYLDGIRSRIGDGVTVDVKVRSGDAGDVILAVADETNARMIVIGTHGRSGFGRWMYGSTASHILRHASTPTVAVGPHSLQRAAADVRITHIMAPLDGNPLSESALPVAVELARATGARLSIARAVPWAVQAYPYTLPDAYVPQVDQELEAGAKAYLQRKQSEISDVETHAFVVRGAVADGLLDFIEQQNVDFVVMSTHARSGLARFALGSVADRVIQGNAPVMLIRPTA